LSGYDESLEEAERLAKASHGWMRHHRIPQNPQNFEVWYNYHGDRDEDLRTHVDRLLDESGTLTAEVSRELFERYFGVTEARETIRGTSERMTAELERVLQHLGEAGRESGAYGNVLEDLAREIEGRDTVGRLMGTVLAATRRMAGRTRELEGALARSAEEVSRLRSGLARIQRDANTDALTGLANRKHFDERLSVAIGEAMELGEDLSLILADIDDFKSFNDRFGHPVGDRVLRLVARCLRQVVAPPATAARFGGEEFAVILPATPLDAGLAVAERVRSLLEGQQIVAKGSARSYGHITMSLGVAGYDPGERQSELIERADRALYAAKGAGRNRVVGERELEPAAVS
jgi:diguanylate cyclase